MNLLNIIQTTLNKFKIEVVDVWVKVPTMLSKFVIFFILYIYSVVSYF